MSLKIIRSIQPSGQQFFSVYVKSAWSYSCYRYLPEERLVPVNLRIIRTLYRRCSGVC